METKEQSVMPRGVGNAFAFQVLNTISFSIVLTTPMLLYFKSLGASATIIGIVSALPPLLNVLQMPAARFVETVGYRAFVLRGWSIRSIFILGLALVPVLPPQIDEATRMALLLFFLFAFNTSRGISVAGFLPWITQWIPEPVRGRYLSRDQMCMSLAMVGTMMATALVFRGTTSLHLFSVVFFASFVSAVASLLFLKRIPDVPPPPRERDARQVPWLEMALHPPFLKLLVYNCVILAALAGGGVFWVPCLRDQFHLSDSQILVIGALTPVTSAACLPWLGKLVDRVGSKPLLALSNVVLAAHFGCWCALGARLLPLRPWSLAVIQSTAGFGLAALNLANTRLVMGTVPALGRSHFFALFSVVTSMTLGVLPVFWGMLLDSLVSAHAKWRPWEWNQYSIAYACLAVIALAAQIAHRHLDEPKAMTTETFFHELFVATPARAITRLITRRPFS